MQTDLEAAILHTGAVSSEGPEKEGCARISRAQMRGSRLITVKDSRRRVAAPHGLSHHERDLLTESFDHMRQRGPGLFVKRRSGKIARRREDRQSADAALRVRMTNGFRGAGPQKARKVLAEVTPDRFR
jgi:hypothetical protein